MKASNTDFWPAMGAVIVEIVHLLTMDFSCKTQATAQVALDLVDLGSSLSI